MDNSNRKFRSKRRCKRKPPKNKYIIEAQKAKEDKENDHVIQSPNSDPTTGTSVVDTSYCQINETFTQSLSLASAPGTSTNKLNTSTTASWLAGCATQLEKQDKPSGFRLVDIDVLQQAITSFALCKICKKGSLCIVENETRPKMGMANCWQFQCTNQLCSKSIEFYTSKKCGRAFDVNRRIVLGVSTIGKGYQALVSLCHDMNMPPPMNVETFSDNFEAVRDATELEAKDSMCRAAVQEHSIIDAEETDITNCKVMFDGTWRKRGHSSLQGGVTAISASTGKCLDYEPLNKICKGCYKKENIETNTAEYEIWKSDHKTKCDINYEGSAPSMEPVGVKRIYERSELVNKLRYTGYIGDGDTKSYSNVRDAKPYGDIEVKKLECVGHVQKRMGTALRNLKKEWGSKRLSDGKTMGGRGRLTDARIDKLQIYYGLAIRRNKGDHESMRREVNAGLLHVSSTNEKPQHELCPKGLDSWCKWQKCLAERQDLFLKLKSQNKKRLKKHIQLEVERSIPMYQHSDPLPVTITKELEPIYERLSRDDLLLRCIDGLTQNRCESINQLIWIRCPKQTSSGRTKLDFAMADAVCLFNDGKGSHAKILQRLRIEPGVHTLNGLFSLDKRRRAVSQGRANALERKIRQTNRQAKKSAEEVAMLHEGPVYGPGIAD